jgi:hypothetical protein
MARGRQFRFRFLGSQRLSLEGNFDTRFDTYAPEYYAIDSLSFITPEVMQIMLEADDCDIEIAEDRLFLYASLIDVAQVPEFQQYGNKLGAAIDDNIDAYKDSYVAGAAARTTTTSFARQLLRSPVRPAVIAGLLFVPFVVMMYFGFTKNSALLVSRESLIVDFMFGSYVYKAVSIVRSNRSKISSFQAMVRYVQSNPGRR